MKKDKNNRDAVMQMFPVNVFRTNLQINKEKKKKVLKFIKDMQKEDKVGEIKSNRGGYHSKPMKYYDVIGTAIDFIPNAIVDILNKSIIPKTLLEKQNMITQENIVSTWFIINKKNDFNAKHNHPPAWYSGVYYVKVPKDSGKIVFYDTCPERRFEHLTQTHGTIHVEEGDLLLFPGWFEHAVEKSQSNQERIVISFNIVRPDYAQRQ